MGRRIVNIVAPASTTRTVTPGAAATPQPDLSQYADRLKNLIPAEVSAIYIAGQGIIPSEQKMGLPIWAVFCLIAAIVFTAKESKTAENNPGKQYPVDWTHVAISSISFIIWVYTLGGPFVALGISVPWAGALIMLGWTFMVPVIYKGAKA